MMRNLFEFPIAQALCFPQSPIPSSKPLTIFSMTGLSIPLWDVCPSLSCSSSIYVPFAPSNSPSIKLPIPPPNVSQTEVGLDFKVSYKVALYFPSKLRIGIILPGLPGKVKLHAPKFSMHYVMEMLTCIPGVNNTSFSSSAPFTPPPLSVDNFADSHPFTGTFPNICFTK